MNPLAVTSLMALRKQMSDTFSVLTVKPQKIQTIHIQHARSFYTPLPIPSRSPNMNLPRVFHPRLKEACACTLHTSSVLSLYLIQLLKTEPLNLRSKL